MEDGIALLMGELYQKAFPYLTRAIEEQPYNANAWYWYGVWHEKTGRFSDAQRFYMKAMDIDPSLPQFSRAVAYPSAGDRIPLWDPKRPARITAIPTDATGVMIVPEGSAQSSRLPARAVDYRPDPVAPVYYPPEPMKYIPPEPVVEEVVVVVETDVVVEVEGGLTPRSGGPVYIPPEPVRGVLSGDEIVSMDRNAPQKP